MADDDNIHSLGLRQFHSATYPTRLNPRTALEAAIEWIDGPDSPRPTHIIVIVGRDAVEDAGASSTRFFQAGSYRHHGQMGLMLEGMHMIRDSGKQ